MSENRDEDGRLREEVFMSEKRTSSLKMLRVRANALNSHKFLFKYHTHIYILQYYHTGVNHSSLLFFSWSDSLYRKR